MHILGIGTANPPARYSKAQCLAAFETSDWFARVDERGHVIQGGRRWVISVKPGATQTLKANYRVKLYANNELVGGNRREV